MRIHRIYCNSVSEQGNVFDLDQPQSTHISKVLRLKLGNEIDVFDGKGSSAICKIIEINRSSIVLERISEVKKLNPTHPKINAILPLIKKDNLHFMLQKLTEVGVYEFIFYKPDLGSNEYVTLHSTLQGEYFNRNWKTDLHRRNTPGRSVDNTQNPNDGQWGSNSNTFFTNP